MSIDVAVIDSGINPFHSHVGQVQGGLGFLQGPDGRVTPDPDFRDEIGHGTAISGIIRAGAPAAALIALKIFRRELRASFATLVSALSWAVNHDLKVIHLSLGTVREESRAPLMALCEKAFDKGLIIIASATSLTDRIYPATFETVLGVTRDRQCRASDLLFFPGSPIEFGACGHSRPLSGKAQEQNFSGSSFAPAHVTARVASLLETNPSADASEIRDMLKELALRSS